MVYTPVPIRSVELSSPFYLHLDQLMRTSTLPAIIDSLKTTGRFYAMTWTRENAKTRPHPFWDSDVYKVLEACCYYLIKKEDKELTKYVNEAVRNIKAAQWDDGYLNSYYTLTDPGNRFTNLRDMHELYCLGHLSEAAAAYHYLTGSNELIVVVRKMLELVRKIVLPKGGVPGHEEIEIGLLRLYEITKDDIFLDTAKYFILERGKKDENNEYYFDREAKARGGDPYAFWGPEWRPWFKAPREYAYMQAHAPLVEQQTIEGHSVRAMYYLIASQHYAVLSENKEVKEAVLRLFKNTINQKLYVTGGIGSIMRSEGFGPNYWLPDQQEGGCCYSETCASFALIILCERLLRGELKGVYGDVMERAFLNCVLGAVGMEGGSFYYENPLATLAGHAHERSRWFDVACCPPNVAKLLGLLPSLIYSTQGSTVAIHLFIGSTIKTTVDGKDVTINMETGLPWDGNVKLDIESESPITVAIRIPSWAAFTYQSSVKGDVKDGYLYISTAAETSTVDLFFPTTPRFVYAHPYTRKEEVAVMRGPLVYCAESVDNDVDLEITGLKTKDIREVKKAEISGVTDVPLLEVSGEVKSTSAFGEELYSDVRPKWEGDKKIVLLPYFLRMNRGGEGGMRVWLKDLGN